MGIFDRLYYGKAGKRDYSEMDMPKTRLSLFFLVLKDRLFDLIKVNFLQLLFWIPFMVWTFINVAAIQSLGAEETPTPEALAFLERYREMDRRISEFTDQTYRELFGEEGTEK